MRTFVLGLRNEHENADKNVSWEGQEGGYQIFGDSWDSYDLVWDHAAVSVGDGLLEAVQELLDDQTWVEKDFAWRRRDTVLNGSWDEFCEAVKYRSRYVIWLEKGANDEDGDFTGEVPPARILEEVGRLLETLDLVRVLPKGHKLWRAQTHGRKPIEHSGARIGTATLEFAKQPNRMNPAGSPMCYGRRILPQP